MELDQKKCVACEGNVAPYNQTEADVLLKQVPGWVLSADAKSISRSYTFKDFAGALAFVNTVGAIAESEGHRPDIAFSWGRADIRLTTHAINGLSENDFIVAAKINRIEVQ